MDKTSRQWMKGRVYDILLVSAAMFSTGIVLVYAWHRELEAYFQGKFQILYYGVLVCLLLLSLVFFFHLLKLAVVLEVDK